MQIAKRGCRHIVLTPLTVVLYLPSANQNFTARKKISTLRKQPLSSAACVQHLTSAACAGYRRPECNQGQAMTRDHDEKRKSSFMCTSVQRNMPKIWRASCNTPSLFINLLLHQPPVDTLCQQFNPPSLSHLFYISFIFLSLRPAQWQKLEK